MKLLDYISNPLIAIVSIIIILIVILAIFRASNLTMGFGVRAHLGNLRTSFSIEGFENESTPVLVMYYAEWCGHCKNTKPELEKAKNAYSGPIQIVMLDGDAPENSALMKQEDIQGFPTIRYYKSGMPKVGVKNEYEEYDGGRKKDDFLQFLNRMA